MDLIGLDRFMRSKRAPAKVALIFAASTIGVFALAKWLRNPVHIFNGEDAAYLLSFALVTASFSALGVLSWRHLWRSGRTPAEVAVFDFGVRRVGIWAVLLSPLFAVALIFALTGGISVGALFAVLPVSVVVLAMMLPLGLWAGYGLGYRRIGSAISQMGGIDERNMPPAVSDTKQYEHAA
jgi:hypothetical protein